MSQIATVKVQDGDSYAIINESDFDSKQHKLYEEPKQKAPAATPPARKGK